MLRSHGHWAALFLAYRLALVADEPDWPGSSERSSFFRSGALARAVAIASASPGSRFEISDERLDSALRKVPICVVWNKLWAGELGASILYRFKQHDPEQVEVGYFVFWSTERPWGENEQTRWVVPALLIDAFYTRTLFVLPGIQQAMYGWGDIEGARVRYRLDGNHLEPVSIVVDDTSHRETSIDVQEAVDAEGRVMLFSDVWSHQLAGRHALAAIQAGARLRCYERGTLHPLTREVASNFRLGTPNDPRRAKPAWRLD